MGKNTLFIKMADGEQISPELHGQFIEHLGACIDGGLWVGEDSQIPNADGIRLDVVAALKAIEPPVLRWPGGCFADMYHWEDGIGKRDARTATFNTNFGTNRPENNQFGTHEFIRLCRDINAKPWININMLTGSVREMVEWAEYCNRPAGTKFGDMRKANGSEEPFNVMYWGIGNESWAGGGNFTAEGYANEYRRYSTAFPGFSKDGESGFAGRLPVKMVAVGPDGNKPAERVRWTQGFFEALSKFRTPQIDAYDLHFYNWNSRKEAGTDTEFTENEWYKLIAGAQEIEPILLEQHKLLKEGLDMLGKPPFGERKIDLIIGEWGNWHAPFMATDKPALWQQNTMRDAVTAALTLDIFHRHCDKVKLACLAQSINVLGSLILTDGDAAIRTPTYHVFSMYMPHRGGMRVEIEAESDTLYSGITDVRTVNSFASVKGDILTLSVVNTNYSGEELLVLESISELELVSSVKLTGAPNAHNTAQAMDNVKPEKGNIPAGKGTKWSVKLDPASVNVFTYKIK